MKNKNFIKTALILFVLAGTTTTVQAQKKKLSLKERMNAAKEKLEKAANGSSAEKEEVKKEVKPLTELNEWHRTHEGQVVFYDKAILWQSKSTSDSQSNVITERVIADNKPFSFRAYLGKPCSGKENCYDLDIKYTIAGVSLSTNQLKEEMPEYYRRMASMASFTDRTNYTAGVALVSDKGNYSDTYVLQEDAYRILLSKVKDKLTVGATVTLKVEIIELGEVKATGEIPLKVTEASKKLQNLNCRCGKPGITDKKVIEDVKEAFNFQFDDVEEVHKVVLLSRDWNMNYDNSYPVKQIVGKGMKANIVYTGANGITMMVKRYVFYEKTPSGFADKIKIGKHDFYLPVSPTCAM